MRKGVKGARYVMFNATRKQKKEGRKQKKEGLKQKKGRFKAK
jgi:hypothetical protein